MTAGNKKKVKSWKSAFLIDLAIAIFVLAFVFLIYLHLFFDSESTEIIISGIHISHGFPQNQVFVWYILNSIIMFTYLTAIFISSYDKWRFYLLPSLWYFPVNLLFMYTSFGFNSYWDYVFSIPGLIAILLITSMILLLDNLFKKYVLAYSIKITTNEMIKELVYSGNSKLNDQIQRFLKKKSKYSVWESVIAAYYLQELLDQRNSKNRENASELDLQNLPKRKNSTLLIMMIIISTGFFFLEHFIPSNSKTLNFAGIVIDSYGFDDVKTLVWYISQKFLLINGLIIWFITSPYWWRWAIWSPFFLSAYQMWEAFQPEIQIVSVGNLNIAPLVIASFTLVLLISVIVRHHSDIMDHIPTLKGEMERGISELSKNEKLLL